MHLNPSFANIYTSPQISEGISFEEKNTIPSRHQPINVNEDLRELEPFFRRKFSIVKIEKVSEILFQGTINQAPIIPKNPKIMDLQNMISHIILPEKSVSQEASFLRIKNRNFLRKNRSSLDVRRHISIDIIDANYVSNSVDIPILINFP